MRSRWPLVGIGGGVARSCGPTACRDAAPSPWDADLRRRFVDFGEDTRRALALMHPSSPQDLWTLFEARIRPHIQELLLRYDPVDLEFARRVIAQSRVVMCALAETFATAAHIMTEERREG